MKKQNSGNLLQRGFQDFLVLRFMGAKGLEPLRPCGQRIFILLQLSLLSDRLALYQSICDVENWTLSLPSAESVRVAPVESLHLLKQVIGFRFQVSGFAPAT